MSNLNSNSLFWAKYITTSKHSDGSKTVHRTYDTQTANAMDLWSFFTTVILGALIAPILSPIILIHAVRDFCGRFQTQYLMCIVLSGYFLYDAYKGWIVLMVNFFFLNESIINWFVAINAGVIVCSLLLWILGRLIFNILFSIDSIPIRFLFIIFVIGIGMAIGIKWANSITHAHPEWVEKNVEFGKYAKK